MSEVVCSLEEPYWRPCDESNLFDFFAHRALPGVEVVDAERLQYRRVIDLERLTPAERNLEPRPALMCVDFDGPWAEVEVRAASGPSVEPEREEEISLRVRRLFDLESIPLDFAPKLMRSAEFAREGFEVIDVRLPGAWCRWELAVRAVLGQQISVAGARTLAGRLVGALGSDVPETLLKAGLAKTFPRPEEVADFDLRAIGLPASRARALRELAARAAGGELRFDASPREVRQRLLDIKGIGPWTVEYIAMRALGDRDAFPAGDLGLRKAIDREQPPSAAELEAMAEAWRPVRAYAAILLWRRGGGG